MRPKVFNFGAGPAKLPESILQEAQEEFLDWQGLGMSITEIGHRTPEFLSLLQHAEQSLRQLIHIPTNYSVLFLGVPARMQFAMIPMNFLHLKEFAGYFDTGIWSSMAYAEAQRLKNAYCIASSSSTNYSSIPERNHWTIKDGTQYIYYTPNETVNGNRFYGPPSIDNIPLIADMTSCLLSEPIDVSKYALVFAGAQKNIANAGLTVVIIREDFLLRRPAPEIPLMLDYKFQVEQRSLYATPPVFNCYLAAKMFDWIKKQGGVETLFENNCKKAAKLYQFLDQDDFYLTPIACSDRSIMNVCFSTNNLNLDNKFLSEADSHGLKALKGHRLVGGLRASLYNSMPMEGVDALIQFMSDFKEKYQ